MILRSEIKFAGPEPRARAKKFHCHEHGNRVDVETEPGKHNRAVFFEGSKVECFSVETGEQCEANTYGTACCHAFAADRRKRINKKRRATLARKKFKIVEAA